MAFVLIVKFLSNGNEWFYSFNNGGQQACRYDSGGSSVIMSREVMRRTWDITYFIDKLLF
ncbi:MAG: hypothetical protein ACXWT3_00835 [Methylococcaceae bacterium]